MSEFLENDAEDLTNMLADFGEEITYNGVTTNAIIDYLADAESTTRGQKVVAEIEVASSVVVSPRKEDVVLICGKQWAVESIVSGDKNSWRLRIRRDVRSKVGR